jgi:hypothetical protein
MRQMANQEMKRSLRDPCGAASAQHVLEKHPARRHHDRAGMRFGALKHHAGDCADARPRALRFGPKSKAKSGRYALKSETGKTPGIASWVQDGAALDC